MEDIHDIAPPISLHISYLPLYVLLGLLLSILVFALADAFSKKISRKAKSILIPSSVPPQIDYKARAQLRLQKARHLMEESRFDEYFLEVSSLVKEYLGDVHNVSAEEMTSSELLKTFSTISQLPLFFELCYRY